MINNLKLNIYNPAFRGKVDTKKNTPPQDTDSKVNIRTISQNGQDTTYVFVHDPNLMLIGPDLVPNVEYPKIIRMSTDTSVQEQTDKIANKVNRFIKMIPDGSKLTKPSLVLLENESNYHSEQEVYAAFTIDKTDPNKIQVTIKTPFFENSDWDKFNEGRVLRCVFDKNGRMTEADLTNTYVYGKNKSSGDNIHFSRDAKNKRSIIMEGAKFQPAKDTTDSWQIVKSYIYDVRRTTADPSTVNRFFMDYSYNPVVELFKKLTYKDSTILY